jgi:subtilisin family serine protease
MKSRTAALGFAVLLGLQAGAAALDSRPPAFAFRGPRAAVLSARLLARMGRLPARDKAPIWVFFRDRGPGNAADLEGRIAVANLALDERCRARRFKTRGRLGLLTDEADLAPAPGYVAAIRAVARRERVISRWLNAVSVEATWAQAEAIARLPFVAAVDLVAAFRRTVPRPAPADLAARAAPDAASAALPYGDSFSQLDQINVPPLHRLGYSGRGVVVAMLDTGFRRTHEVFRNARVLAARDFVNGDDDVAQDPNNPNDYSDSHGTGTWSVLGGYAPGQLIGPAYGADFLLAKTESDRFELPIEEDYWVAGIEWAESLGAEVVSSSLGYTDWYTFADMNGLTAVTTRAANRAVELGIVVVNAAGNERGAAWNHIIAPADGFEVLAVGAVTSSGTIASFSSPGPTADGRIKPEVCALGVNNRLAANLSDGIDTYDRGSGTSFATPLVGGVAALLLEAHPEWTPREVRAALLASASRSAAPDNDFGWGIANAAVAAHLPVAIPKLVSFRVDDDAAGGSSGNGNGRAEPGEAVEIFITLMNEGTSAAESLRAALTSAQPDFRVEGAGIAVPALGAGETVAATAGFVVRVPGRTLVRRAVFRLTVSGPGVLPLEESLVLSVEL